MYFFQDFISKGFKVIVVFVNTFSNTEMGYDACYITDPLTSWQTFFKQLLGIRYKEAFETIGSNGCNGRSYVTRLNQL